ncbi:16S rRNA (adenine(1518)-N(6)/adenine(1519)-N(6))-dimethyltransferase RsmA [Peptostreptococcaceae bacterium AGR-M142]
MDILSNPKVTKDIVDKHGFKFSKSLGQNFLIDNNILNKIVDSALIEEDDYVIEVGPGIGTLTREIAKRAKKVIAVEIDKTLIPILEETLADFDNASVVNEDILKLDIKKLIDEEFEGKRVKLVANLPYYVTTPIIMRFLEEEIPLKNMVVMIQKEVGERIESKPNKKTYGALSVGVQFYSSVDIIGIVPKTVFIPQPKVDSIVIRLNIYEQLPYKVSDRKKFFKIVRGAFAQRRKTLLNTLSSSLSISKDEIKELVKDEIDLKRRGETLSIEEFVKLYELIYEGK